MILSSFLKVKIQPILEIYMLNGFPKQSENQIWYDTTAVKITRLNGMKWYMSYPHGITWQDMTLSKWNSSSIQAGDFLILQDKIDNTS